MIAPKSDLIVPKVLEKISKAKDLDTIILNENKLACMFASPILLLLSVMNTILRHGILKENLGPVLMDSVICLILGICFEIILRTKLKLNTMVNLVAALYGVWCVFVFIRFSKLLGPLIWYVAFILLLLAMFQVRKNMLMVIGFIITLFSIYSFFRAPLEVFYFYKTYYGFIIMAFTFAFLLAGVVHRCTMSRYKSLFNHLQTVIEQKMEIEALYQEVAAHEEELYMQNERLIHYNNMIKKSEAELRFLAYHDMLTELPNRKMICNKLDEKIKNAKRNKTIVYVVYIDMDWFKNINDTLGHDAGDKFIYIIADRIKSALHEEDIIGRMGGDEFALIIPRNISEKEIIDYLNMIKDKFEEIVSIDGIFVSSSASLGIAQFPKDGSDSMDLIRYADIAMYKSKEQGKNKIQFYQPHMQEDMIRRLRGKE